MEGFLILFLIVLQRFAFPSNSSELQTIYPGCKSSPNHTDMSYLYCTEPGRLPENGTRPSNSSKFHVGTSRLSECFTLYSDYVSISPAVEGHVEFNGPASPKASFECRSVTCVCDFQLWGPPDTFFLISTEHYNRGAEDLHCLLHEDDNFKYFDIAAEKLINSEGNALTFSIQYGGDVLGAVSFGFSVHAFSNCLRQLQVHCLSNTSGLIETPAWALGGPYPDNMNSCVSLHVPDNHVTMISLIGLDVEAMESEDVCYDYLMFYQDGDCSGTHGKKVCAASALKPSVIKDARVLSFLFVSNEDTAETGFRLLYSFHNASEEPYQLSDGKWECNVSYFDSFRQHFMCVPESFCSDNSDKTSCPTVGLCGSNLLTVGERCLRAFRPQGLTTWNRASATCISYGGHLAVLNRPSELKSVIHFITKKTDLERPVFVGLRIASSVRLHEMYQNTWLWADDTLAVYLPITYSKATTPYCAALNRSNITVVTCNQKMEAGFLCETGYQPDAINTTLISLPTPSDWTTEAMTTCRHGHVSHNFLACDVSAACRALDKEETLPCSRSFSPSVPFFTCRSQTEHVPYTLVCDFRSDCCDGSDEDFCEFPACDSGTQYACADSKQCIDRDLVCNRRRDCVDESDELRCQESLASFEQWANTLEPPARVDFTGDGSFNVVPLTNTTCPETHYQCPGGGYCLPVYTRCNEFYDCPGKEDEMGCDHYSCPGFYRCRGSKICVHEQHLCDNIYHCPEHDDELMCNVTCPESCHCYGHAFICTEAFTTDNYTELRSVDASGTGMKPDDFLHYRKLIHLSLKSCGITTLRHLDFPNLWSLDLSSNDIRELISTHFRSLKNLVHISLSYNSLMSLDSFLYTNLTLPNIIDAHLSGIAIPYPTDTFFDTFPKVQLLNMSGCGVKKLTGRGFQSLTKLRLIDLRGCPVDTFHPGVFEGLNQLEMVYTDNYKLCCPAVLPEEMQAKHCYAPKNEVSTCDALLKKDLYRVALTLYAILALTGNLLSFVYRVFIDRSAVSLGYEVFVSHLSIADSLMGVYLAIIGIADRIYFGNYQFNDEAWKYSVACKLAGFLSLTSSEVSAYLICLITLERFLVIGFPHRNLRFNRLSAHVASVAVWLVGLILAVVPLLPMTSHWNFYGQSGICIPLPITRKEFEGSDYAFGVMIVGNFILFLFIAIGQLLIYWSIHVNTVSSKDSGRKARDTAVARRLLAVVMTDFICWFPIGVLGLMARSGVPISSEINVAIAIFVLPFNSALNPFLYTINMLMEKRRKVSKARKSRTEGDRFSSRNRTRVFDVVSESRKGECNYSKEEALELFQTFLEQGLLTPEQVRQQVWEVYEG